MAQSRTTFGKRQRERDKQAKQQAKQEKRQARASERDRDEGPTTPSVSPAEEARALNALAHLQEQFGAGALAIEQFEEARDELRKSLTID